MDKKDKIHADVNTTKGAGRTSNPGEDKEEEITSHDISEVDRQEGEMEHGEKGGNFNKDNSGE